jgi:hypothetical protein
MLAKVWTCAVVGLDGELVQGRGIQLGANLGNRTGGRAEHEEGRAER